MRGPWAQIRGLTGRCVRVFTFLFCAFSLFISNQLVQSGAAPHPRLVSGEAASCATCHEDLLRDRDPVHAPARDDCTACHEVTVSEEGTRISLMADEPPLCLVCHDNLTSAVEGALKTPHFPVSDSCLTCHDPHGSGRLALLNASLGELCATCHDPVEVEPKHKGQMTPATDCTRCHQPHGSETEHLLRDKILHAPFADGSCEACHRPPFGTRVRLRARGERLCSACHGVLTETAAAGGSTHAALQGERGRAGCLNCHDPHMSDQAHLALEAGSRLCGTCHGDILEASLASTGHPPAAEDCLNCHTPHASTQAHLLNAAAQELCRTCHDVEDEELIGAHLGADLGTLECASCHTPHGTGHPHLLAQNLHPPLLEECNICHEGRADQLMEEGESSLCLTCHQEIGETAVQAPVPHPAMEVARCADCHNPHASKQERLVKFPSGGECTACHEEQAPGQGERGHGVIDLIGCRACHEPHGGNLPRLLRRTGADLCLSCHDPSKPELSTKEGTVRLLGRFEVPAEKARGLASLRLSADGQRNHPVPNHRVLGTPTEDELKRIETSYREELTCLSCHDPHKGRSKGLFRWDAASAGEACSHCHKK